MEADEKVEEAASATPKRAFHRWTQEEEAALVQCTMKVGRDWPKVANELLSVHKIDKTHKQCRDKWAAMERKASEKKKALTPAHHTPSPIAAASAPAPASPSAQQQPPASPLSAAVALASAATETPRAVAVPAGDEPAARPLDLDSEDDRLRAVLSISDGDCPTLATDPDGRPLPVMTKKLEEFLLLKKEKRQRTPAASTQGDRLIAYMKEADEAAEKRQRRREKRQDQLMAALLQSITGQPFHFEEEEEEEEAAPSSRTPDKKQ